MLVSFPDIYCTGKEVKIGELIQVANYTRIRALYRYIVHNYSLKYILISLGNSNHTNAYKILEEW